LSASAVNDLLGPSILRGAVAVAGFAAGAAACLLLAVAEWGAWTLIAPGRKLSAAGPDEGDGDAGEPIEARTADGLRLAGAWFPAAGDVPTARTAIVIHGFAEDPRGFRARADALARRGWNAAAIDLRGHGASEGEHTSFGGRESDDLRAWVATLADRVGPDMSLALWGRSMGAAVAIRAAADHDDPRIAALVLEAPYHDLEAAIAVLIRRFRLPAPRLLARLVARRARSLAGVSLTRPRPIDLAPRVDVPVLIVHGADDALVSPADARRLADAFPSPAPLVEVAGARHTDILDVAGPDVLDRIAAFLDATVPVPKSEAGTAPGTPAPDVSADVPG
jgi:alpha-beta hydrolase superfamily lysophospholipase